MRKRNVVLLGATGSIGQSACRVAKDLPERVRIVGMSGFRNMRQLALEANALRPEALAVPDEASATQLRLLLDYQPSKIFLGPEGLSQLAAVDSAEMVLVAIVGWYINNNIFSFRLLCYYSLTFCL